MKVHCNLPRTVGRTCQRTEAATGADRSDQACRSEYRRRIAHHRLPRRRGGAISDPSRFALPGWSGCAASVIAGWRADRRDRQRFLSTRCEAAQTGAFSDYSTERFRFRPSGHRVGSRSARPGFRHPEVLEAKLVQPDRVQVSICRYSDDRITSKFHCV